MPVLIIGAFDYKYIYDHWYEPLKRLLPHSSISVDINVLLSFMTREEVEDYLFELIDTYHVKSIMFYHDIIFSDLSDKFFLRIKKNNVKIIAFYADDEPPFWYERNRKYDHHYTCIATHSIRGYLLRDSNFKGDLYYMPWGFNPRVIDTSEEKVASEFDIIFIGRNKDSLSVGIQREDGEVRDKQLQIIANESKIHGWKFAIFGFGWESHPFLSNFYKGQLNQYQFNEVLRQTKIIFNPSYSWDGKKLYPQVKLRHFEMAAHGHAVQLTNANDELGELYVQDNEIIFYNNEYDLVKKIEYLLSHPEICNEISNKAKDSSLKNHTIDSRIIGLLNYNGIEIDDDFASVPLVSSIQFHECFEKLKQEVTNIKSDYCYFNYMDMVPKFDIAIIKDLLLEGVDVIEGPILIHGYSKKRDPIQPRRDEMNACIIENGEIQSNCLPYLKCLLESEVFFKTILFSSVINVVVLKKIIVQSNSIKEFIDSVSFLSSKIKIKSILLSYDFTKYLNTINVSGNFTQSQRALFNLLMSAKVNNNKIIIYGARGDLAESTIEFIRLYGDNLNVLIVDNGLVGSNINNICIHSHSIISDDMDAIILVCAAISGPSIIKDCKLSSPKSIIFPMYNLFDPAWSIYLE